MTTTADLRSGGRWTTEPPLDWNGDARVLGRRLQRQLGCEVGFDNQSRALYSTDASNYRQVPIGVVWPRNVDDVQAAVAICREFGAPILGRGAGTSLAGQCCNVAVVLDMSRYFNHILQVDPHARLAQVEPGVVLDSLRREAEKHHLTFGPDPATHDHCTLGGMIGNNSCGVHSVMSGRTSDNVAALDILTYDGQRMQLGPVDDSLRQQLVRAGGRRGEIYGALGELVERYGDAIRQRFPRIPRRVSGFNLLDLLPENGFHVARSLVGSEGTCAVVLGATLHLIHSPRYRTMVVVGFDDVCRAGDYVPEVLEFEPLGLEGMDQDLIADNRRKKMNLESLKLLPRGDGLLLAEFGADDRDEAVTRAHRFEQAIRGRTDVLSTRVFEDPDEQLQIWKVRESGLGATARVPHFADTWPGWEDSAVDPQHLGDYMRELRKLMNEFGYRGDFYGHFGQGCLHTRISFDLRTSQGIDKYRKFMEQAADLALEFGGSFSGEHGDGQARAELLPKMFGQEVCQAFREFKRIWDPDGKMNPGKVVDPYPMTSNLRLGPDFHPADPPTWFGYAEDQGSLSRAALRCVGVGACRRESAGVMCPSYMVTRQEKYSTRGRARLLLEMLQGEVITDGWRSREVKDALDLCLACKGCKGECPVNVDMATYKAEFLSHYYRGRLRPAAAYSMGLIYWWARLASRMPRLVNTVLTAPLLSSLLKRAGGIAPQRQLPLFATEPFRARFARRPLRNPEGPPVIFWPDTFSNFFHPETAEAAVDVLESAGCHVLLPPGPLCCGRPLYDFGMLHLARRQLQQVVHALRPALDAQVPIVGIEPSCVAVFRDELVNILPADDQARQLRDQVFTLDEFLQSHTDLQIPPLHRKALVHGHCHHRSVLNFNSQLELLVQAGLEVRPLDSGCCGMAGSFGFERDKFPVSMACGERVLLPEVRKADDATLIVADGFSCREQIRQGTGRQALHSAQILQMALAGPQPLNRPSRRPPEPRRTWTAGQIGAASAVLLLGGLAAWTWARQKP